ncbi:hypothetical protein K503DRAFT_780329 [Rhizopogon vinicolor AM-OR11-026]|uniref:Uncharacterized protein n=1 Tax=Rhizopogon vinicolor AM-OR11-026 TaxID=1314800 RepID=A0A1B7NAM6_9AGAM|nr:hypothetical protein K503DRAFT_780329 [Rhizopogon vinicolor AM-OR11-026]
MSSPDGGNNIEYKGSINRRIVDRRLLMCSVETRDSESLAISTVITLLKKIHWHTRKILPARLAIDSEQLVFRNAVFLVLFRITAVVYIILVDQLDKIDPDRSNEHNVNIREYSRDLPYTLYARTTPSKPPAAGTNLMFINHKQNPIIKCHRSESPKPPTGCTFASAAWRA